MVVAAIRASGVAMPVSRDAPRVLRHVAIHGQLAEGLQELLHERRSHGAGQQLRTG